MSTLEETAAPPRPRAPVARPLERLAVHLRRVPVRLALAVGALAIVFNLALGAMLWTALVNEMGAAVGKEVLGAVDRAADDLEDRLATRLAGLRTEADAAVERFGNRNFSTGEALAFLESLNTLSSLFDGLAITNNEGEVLAGRPFTPNLVGLHVSDRDYFQRARRSSVPFVTEPFVSRATGKAMVLFVAPLVAPSGRFIGILTGGLDLHTTPFAHRLRNIRLGESGSFFVETRDGTTLMHPNRSRIFQRSPASRSGRALERALEGHSSWELARDDRGRATIVAYRAVQNANWVLGATLPSDEAFATLNRLKGLTMALRIGAGVVLLAFTGILVWVMLQPLARLRGQVEDIEAGRRTEMVDVDSAVEIGRVAEAFNRMLVKERQTAQALAEREAFHRMLNESSPAGVFLIDGKGKLTYANRRFEQILGRDFDQLREWQWFETVDAEHQAGARENWLDARRRRAPFSCEMRARHKNGDEIWLRLKAVPMGDPGHAPGFLHAALDVTAEHSAAAALAQAREHSDLILATIEDALVVIDGSGAIVHLSPAAEHVSGWSRQAASGVQASQVLRIRSEDGDDILRPDLWAAAQLQREDTLLETSGGRRVPVEIVWSRFQGESGGVLAVRDITRRREAARRQEWEALHDPVTGMPNRRSFVNASDEAFARFQRDRTGAYVVLIDLDHFKRVNDLGGHAAGDEMLHAVAEVLTTAVRASDLAARVGGDEFALLLPACTAGRAQSIAETIRAGIAELGVWRNGERLTVGVSQGISCMREADASAEDVRRRADDACYVAKRSGRGSIQVASVPTALHEPS